MKKIKKEFKKHAKKKNLVGYKRPNNNTKYTFSFIKWLRDQNKSCEEFETMVDRLSLEDLVSLKLELTAKHLRNGKFYGIVNIKDLEKIIKISILRFSLYGASTFEDASAFLGMSRADYNKLLMSLGIDNLQKDKIIQTLINEQNNLSHNSSKSEEDLENL